MKIKIILFAVIAGMGLLAWFLIAQISNLKKDRDTQIENVNNLLSENSHYKALNLTLKQTDSISGLKLDSLANALKVKPKKIIRTVEVTQVVSDTSSQATEITPVENQGEVKIWEIQDFGACWLWKGTASLTDNLLSVTREDFTYQNKTTNIYYWKRSRHFWFIHFGKKKTFVNSDSECGESYTREIQIVKK